MIKNFENFNEIDPYGEEDWDDDEVFNKGDIVICANDIGDENNYLKIGNEYKVKKIHFFYKDFISLEGPCENYLYHPKRFKKKKIKNDKKIQFVHKRRNFY